MKSRQIISALLLGCAFGAQAVEDTLKTAWENPPRDVRPGTRWQIQGNALRAQDVEAYVSAIHTQGVMGVEIMSYLPIYEKGNALYGSEAYFEMVKNIVAECKKHGMWATLNFGPGWGLGNVWVPQYDGSKVLVYQELGVVEGQVDMIVEGPGKEDAPYAQRNPKKFEALLAVKMNGTNILSGQTLDLTAHVQDVSPRWFLVPKFPLKTTLPEGRWRLMSVWTALTGQKCAAGSGSMSASGEPAQERLVDHLDKEAVARFAEGTFEKFAPHTGGEFGKTVDCVFGDSFELEQSDFFWSTGFFDEFTKLNGYDLRPLLPQVIYGGTDQTPFLRYDFNHFLHRKGMEGIIGTMADACEKRGMRMRQQPHYRFTVELMEASGRVKRAETEFNIRRFDPNIYPHKLTTSGVRLYGGDWVSCEAYTFIGPKYQIPLEQVKASADGYMRDGVSQIISSAGFYQPEGYLEPYRDVMWPLVQTSPTTSWFSYMKHLNDYIARSCAFLRNTKFESDVLVYSPNSSMWSERVEFPAKHVRDIPFGPLAKMLLASGYDFDTINDDLLVNRAEVKAGELCVGDYGYRALILPRALYMPPEALEKIKLLAENGGLVIALDSLPQGPLGMKDLPANRKRVATMVDSLFAAQGGEKTVGKGKTVFLPACKGFDYLKAWDPMSKEYEPTVVPPGWQAFIEVMQKNVMPDVQFAGGKVSQGLTFYRAKSGSRAVFFMMNLSPLPVDERVTLHACGIPEKWDAMTGKIGVFPEYDLTADGRVAARIQLQPWESFFLVVDSAAQKQARVVRSDFDKVLDVSGGMFRATVASSRLCSAEVVNPDGSKKTISLDVTGIPPALDISTGLWTLDLTDKLGRKQSMQMKELKLWNETPELQNFSGEGIYRTTVDVPAAYFAKGKVFHHWLDLGKVFECAKVLVNGEEIGDLWMHPYRIDVSGKLKPGANRIEIRVVNLDWNYVKGIKEPTSIPAELQNHFGTNSLPAAGGQARVIPTLQKQAGFLPSGLGGPVRIETIEEIGIPIK
ncbi:MAG: glycosyl hydrolase [Kiritimatiellales bacterium]|jgi:hypothetical protein